MTRLEDRRILVRDIEQACAEGARLAPACTLAGINARTLRRWKSGGDLRQGFERVPNGHDHRDGQRTPLCRDTAGTDRPDINRQACML